jgi:hypothetical protein
MLFFCGLVGLLQLLGCARLSNYGVRLAVRHTRRTSLRCLYEACTTCSWFHLCHDEVAWW